MRTLISRASPSRSLREGTWTAMKFACWDTMRRSNRASRLYRAPAGWHGLVLELPAGTERANLCQWRPEDLQLVPGRVGLGDEHAVPMVQTGCVPFRRHAQRHGGLV